MFIVIISYNTNCGANPYKSKNTVARHAIPRKNIMATLSSINTLTASFEQRFDTLESSDIQDMLKNCSELKSFLPKAIEFLNRNNQTRAEEVAHYLMGKVDFLPDGLNAPEDGIPKDVRDALRDLLRTHRYCFTEASEQTIAKLKALNDKLQITTGLEIEIRTRASSEITYMKELNNWVDEGATAEEREIRKRACQAIQTQMQRGNNNLDLSRMSLTTIPPLPENLESLNLNHNNLTSLAGMPRLMPALRILNLMENGLTSTTGMPMMPALTGLNLAYNNIRSLAGMPPLGSLRRLSLMWNVNLSSLAGMPPSIRSQPDTVINLNGCPLDVATIAAINHPVNGAQIFFDMAAHDLRNSAVGSVSEEVKRWLGAETAEKWLKYADSQGGKALASFLRRLHRCAAFEGTEKDESKQELTAILTRMLSDTTFREYCFRAVEASDANCHDNVQAIFDGLRMQMANPAVKDKATLADVVKFQRGRLAATLIDQYVATHVRGGDLLESGMLLKQELSNDLELPIEFRNIKYAAIAKVSNDIVFHKEEAKKYVKSNLTPEKLAKAMAEDETCAAFLEKFYSSEFNDHNELWGKELENLTYKQEPSDQKLEAPGSVDHMSPLEKVRALKHIGDGKKCKEYEKEAKTALLIAVACQAQKMA